MTIYYNNIDSRTFPNNCGNNHYNDIEGLTKIRSSNNVRWLILWAVSSSSVVFGMESVARREFTMWECTVKVERCEVDVESELFAEMSHPAEPYNGQPQPVTETAILCNSHDKVQKQNEVPIVNVKVEHLTEDCVSATDSGIKRGQLKQNSLAGSHLNMAQVSRSTSRIGRSHNDNGTPTLHDAMAVESTPHVKVEEHHYEDACGESNVNTTDGANDGISHEQSCTPMETQEERLGACCGSIGTECVSRTERTNIKLDTRTNGKIYKCEDCEYVTDKKNLIKHVCLHMPKKLPPQNSSKRQMRRCEIEQSYICDHCKYHTYKRSLLQKHLLIHRNKKSFKCVQCEYHASNKSFLTRHMHVHSGEKPYKCEECKYRTSYQSNLKTHMRIHTGEKPYKCGLCDHTTSDQSALKRHLRVHNGKKPYACELCNYRTSHPSALKSHIRTHTGEKPFECGQCEYTTADNSALIRHLRMHNGEKPFECKQCNYKSSYSSALNRHMRVHKKRDII